MLALNRFERAADFRAAAVEFLVANEARNNLALGLLPVLELNPHRYGSDPYFATVEANGRTVATAVMTPPQRLVLSPCEDEDQDALAAIAHDVRAFLAEISGVIAPAPASAAFAGIWAELTGQEVKLRVAERVYRAERIKHPQGVPGSPRGITPQDRPLLLQWYAAFQEEAFGEDPDEAELTRTVDLLMGAAAERRGAFLWTDHEPVCLVAYGGPTPNSMRIGPVYTPPARRRRGYASACTAAVSAWLLQNGRSFVTLFTDLSNPTSNAIYQAIGYEPVCDVDVYDFIPKGESASP